MEDVPGSLRLLEELFTVLFRSCLRSGDMRWVCHGLRRDHAVVAVIDDLADRPPATHSWSYIQEEGVALLDQVALMSEAIAET